MSVTYNVLNRKIGVIELLRNQLLFGVVSSVSPRNNVMKREIGRRPNSYYCMLAKYAAKHDETMMLFAPGDVDWHRRKVVAWLPEHPSRPYCNWQRQIMPLPHSIYENVFVHLAIRGYAAQLRNMARNEGIPIFNPPLPGKWLMAKWLTNSKLARYQPDTLLLPKPSTTLSHIQNWGTAYVKPVGGYGGMDVARVEYLAGQRYLLSIDRMMSGTRKVRKVMNQLQLVAWLSKKQGRPHILQRGLNLLCVNQRRMDFRVVVNRDDMGQWKMIGIVPKLALKDGVVTNLVAGGEICALPDLISIAKKQNVHVPIAKICTCALDVAHLVSSRAPHTGLLGFDIGVEKDNGVFVIEMNPKPARSLLSKDMQTFSAQCLSGFAAYLAKGK